MLTIIIPTIMRPTLDRAIQSVEDQTIRTNYIIVGDVNRIGPGLTRNSAVKEVHTSWVGFLDDDDYLDEHYHEWLQKEKDGYDVVVFRMKNSPLVEEAIPKSTNVDDLEYNQVGISFALRTKLAALYPFSNKVPGEDHELLMRLKKDGYKIKISDKVAYYIGNLKD